jgi:hypothetical protein
VDADGRERVVGTISSLRKQSDPLFLEALDFVAEGMYTLQIDAAISRMDTEGVMLAASMTLSCVFTGLQLLHVKRHPEALPDTSVTMLVVLAVGYAVPLVLNLEAVFADGDSRRKCFVQMTSVGLLEVNEFMLRVSTMLAFVLQMRLLQLALSSRRPAEAAGDNKQAEDSSSSSDAERSTLWICLPMNLLGAVLVWIVHMSDGDVHSQWNRAQRSGLVDDLAGYAGLVLDGFLLPQVVWNAFASSRVRGSRRGSTPAGPCFAPRPTSTTCSGGTTTYRAGRRPTRTRPRTPTSSARCGTSPCHAGPRCWPSCCSCSSGSEARSSAG